MIGLGLSLEFKRLGYKIGYFKPIGVFPVREGNIITDEDAKFFRSALDLTDPVESMCPIVLTEGIIHQVLTDGYAGALDKIAAAFEVVAKDKDVVLIGGMGDLELGMAIDASGAQVVERLDAKVIVVTKFVNLCFCVDRSLSAKQQLSQHHSYRIPLKKYPANEALQPPPELVFDVYISPRHVGRIPNDLPI